MSTYTTVATFTATGPAAGGPYFASMSGKYTIAGSVNGQDYLPGFTVGDYVTLSGGNLFYGGSYGDFSFTRLQFTIEDTLQGENALSVDWPEGYATGIPTVGYSTGWPAGVTITVERLVEEPTDTGYSLPTYGEPTFVDRAWGNLPMQPNTERAADGEGTIVVVEPNAVGNYGWSGFSVFRSEQLDPALGDHVVAVTGYNGFPEFAAAGGATGPTGPVTPSGLTISLGTDGSSLTSGVTFVDTYGNPSGARFTVYSDSVSNYTGRSLAVLNFIVPTAQVAANPMLTKLKDSYTALTTATPFQMDYYSGVPYAVQQDAWVRSVLGNNLVNIEVDSALAQYGPSGWSTSYGVSGNNTNGAYFSSIAGARYDININTLTGSSLTFFGAEQGFTNYPILVGQTMAGDTGFSIYLTLDPALIVLTPVDSYGNQVTDMYGNPAYVNGQNLDSTARMDGYELGFKALAGGTLTLF